MRRIKNKTSKVHVQNSTGLCIYFRPDLNIFDVLTMSEVPYQKSFLPVDIDNTGYNSGARDSGKVIQCYKSKIGTNILYCYPLEEGTLV